jgi:hypothetical protein
MSRDRYDTCVICGKGTDASTWLGFPKFGVRAVAVGERHPERTYHFFAHRECLVLAGKKAHPREGGEKCTFCGRPLGDRRLVHAPPSERRPEHVALVGVHAHCLKEFAKPGSTGLADL